MSEMVERVAAAMVEAMKEFRVSAPQATNYYVSVDDGLRHVTLDADVDMLALARAAIEAMREPTLEMRKACSFSEAERTWPTMIDAALGLEMAPNPAPAPSSSP
jgi:hypothetical protein